MNAAVTNLRVESPLTAIESAYRARESVSKTASTRRHGINLAQCPDTALLRYVAESDERAMEVLCARYSWRVHRFVLRLCSDESLVEDVANEVFVEVWRSAHRFRGASLVSTWILSIARFKVLSSLRRRKDDELDDELAAALPDSADDPEIAVQKKDRVAILRQCMSHLSRTQREIINLAYFQEKPVCEIAELLGVPRNTVKTRMFKARKRMAELLQDAGVDRTYQ